MLPSPCCLLLFTVRSLCALRLLVELERRRVDAVAQARRLRPVLEDVAQVGIAVAAHHFRAAHPEAVVRLLGDVLPGYRLVEAGPARARFELGIRAE